MSQNINGLDCTVIVHGTVLQSVSDVPHLQTFPDFTWLLLVNIILIDLTRVSECA